MAGALVKPGRRTVATLHGDRELLLHEDGAVTIGEDRYDVRAVRDGTWLVTGGARACLAHVAHDGEAYWVHVDGQVHRVEVSRGATPARRRAVHRDAGLSAPMPATVLTVHVEPGQTVAGGETVVVLEAMKMELPVRAPRAGTVAAVHCRPGELVQPGVPLVEIA
jgi:biotin carboxyl carrier protein